MHAICNHLQQIKVAVTTPCNGICSIQLRYLCPLCRCCDGHHYPNSIAVVFAVAWIVITNKIDGCVLGMWDMGACCVLVANVQQVARHSPGSDPPPRA